MVLPVPVTLTVPATVSWKPVPLVVWTASPPLVKLTVEPVLLVIETPSPMPVFSVLVAPVKLMVVLALPEIPMPPLVSLPSLMLPDSVTVPPVRLTIEADVVPVPSPMAPP